MAGQFRAFFFNYLAKLRTNTINNNIPLFQSCKQVVGQRLSDETVAGNNMYALRPCHVLPD